MHALRLVATSLILSVPVLVGLQDGLAHLSHVAAHGAPRAAGSAPSLVARTVHVRALLEHDSLAIPDLQAPGTPVSKADIESVAGGSPVVRFALAVDEGPNAATYPAISSDAGTSWRIAGPVFWVAAAQGASVTSRVGALGPRGAYFWGPGGNTVEVTRDEGRHWWVAGFAGGVSSVCASGGALRVVAFSPSARSGSLEISFLYVSHDAGRTWRLDGEVPA